MAFRDTNGKEHRYMQSALDETYESDPVNHYVDGTIPLEEIEVRDALLIAGHRGVQLTTFDVAWSRLVRPTRAYKNYVDIVEKLVALCAQSREHRAAFCRMSKSETFGRVIRHEMRKIIAACDAGEYHK